MTAYNGAASKSNSANRWFYLHVQGTTPLVIDSVIAATLTKATGDYGYKLVVPIPANLVQSARRRHRDAAELLDLGRGHGQGPAVHRHQGLLRRQAEVQGHVRLHRRHEQDGHRHGRLQEVALSVER